VNGYLGIPIIVYFFQYFVHRYLKNVDCLSFVMCPLLAPHLPRTFSGFFLFFFAAATDRTNKTNKAGSMWH
jgi:hypothetical protein